MLTTLVTYERPDAAVAMIQHLLNEPGSGTVVVVDNGGLMEKHGPDALIAAAGECAVHRVSFLGPRPNEWPRREDLHRLVVIDAGRNLGAGGGRNLALLLREPGEPFLRVDDDWRPDITGWLEQAEQAMARTTCGLVRLNPALSCGPTLPRLPDSPGPIWLVAGDAADALGFFYLGFGRTLLDDLEYSRRLAVWCRRAGRLPELVDLDWRVSDLCGTQRGWNPPWDLFKARCKRMEAAAVLFVPFEQGEPGCEWRMAGRVMQETK